MDCNYLANILKVKALKDIFESKLSQERIPFGGGMELTSRCNLNCSHCYAASCRKKKEMTNLQIKNIIKQLIESGTLSLFLTGGEPLLREDFEDIYVFIKKQGIILSVLTNGTLINERIIDLFKHYPPIMVDISMYGMKESTYERITQVPGSYNAFRKGIELLSKNGIHFTLKTVALNENVDEIYEMKEFAKQLGVGFRYSFNLRAMNDKNLSPIDHRINSEKAFTFDIEDEDRNNYWKDIFNSNRRFLSRQRQKCLYYCRIAQYSFHIGSIGMLYGCVRERCHGYDLLNGTFKEGWECFLPKALIEKRSSDSFKCLHCDALAYCDQCPADFELEYGDPEKPIPFMCEIAFRRKDYFSKVLS